MPEPVGACFLTGLDVVKSARSTLQSILDMDKSLKWKYDYLQFCLGRVTKWTLW